MDLDRIGRQPFLLCAVALILALCGCSPYTMGARGLPVLPVGATAAVSEVPYVVTGTTVPEIRLSLRTAATAALGNSAATSRRVGLHRSWLGYRYRFAQQGVSCQITELTIELESTIQVPRWTDREAADSTVVAMWDTYITVLRGHEYTHREYLYLRARDISQELLRTESRTCTSMTSIVNSTVERINERYRELNARFDAESRGTIMWPPREVSGPGSLNQDVPSEHGPARPEP